MEKEKYCREKNLFFYFFRETLLQNHLFIKYFIGGYRWDSMAKKQFAPPVTNFSVSCDPAMVAWLNEYAHKHRTTRSKIVRKALIDFRAEHKDAPALTNAPLMDPERRCVECDATVIRVPGVSPICTRSSHHKQPDSPVYERVA